MSFLQKISVDGYVSIICSCITLIGTYITVKFAKSQVKEDKRISVKPFLYFRLGKMKGFYEAKEEELNKDYNNPTNDIYLSCLDYKKGDIGKIYVLNFKLEIENLGLGRAINCKIIKIYNKKYMKNYMRFNKLTSNHNVNISVDEYKHINFNLVYELDNEKLQIIGKEINLDDFHKIREELIDNSKTIYIDIIYKDLLNNKYLGTLPIKFGLDVISKEPLIYQEYKHLLGSNESKKLKCEIIEYRPIISIYSNNFEEKFIKILKNNINYI